MSTPPPNVLIVDQVTAIRSLLSRRFSRVGCQPYEASTAIAALRLVESGIRFDFALIDITAIDKLDELVLKIGRAKVFLTSSRNEADLAEELQCRYWQKPFNITDLIAAALPLLPNRAHVALEDLRPHEVSTAIVDDLGMSATACVRKLAIALHRCASCTNRCPGLYACRNVQALLHDAEEQTTRLAS